MLKCASRTQPDQKPFAVDLLPGSAKTIFVSGQRKLGSVDLGLAISRIKDIIAKIDVALVLPDST
jgi:hypothetical protein